MLPLLLLACTSGGVNTDPLYTLTGPETPPLADPAVPVPVTVALDDAIEEFAARETWPKLTLTLSSGTWLGGTSGVLTEDFTERTRTAWFLPALSASSVVVDAALSYQGATWRSSTTIALCPAALGGLGLSASAAAVDAGDDLALTASVRTATGGAPSPGTAVSFAASGPEGLDVLFSSDPALVDASGNATVSLVADGATGILTIQGTATPPGWAGCEAGQPATGAVELLVQEPEAEESDDDTGDTG